MRRAVGSTRAVMTPAPTATCVVKFEQRPRRARRREQPVPVDRVPRVTRLLALAHRIDGMIRSGELRDWAEAARLLGVSRARMTQIANLLLLSPRIQENILEIESTPEGKDMPTEHRLRHILSHLDWYTQERDRSLLSPLQSGLTDPEPTYRFALRSE